MNKIITIFVLFAVLAGCASTSNKYGDFTVGTEGTLAEQVINDAVGRLARSYPVGKTVFRLDAATTKKAGEYLENSLRDTGFGVSYQDGVPLNYIFDDYSVDKKDGDKYRLTLVVDNVEFSRIYFLKQGELMKSSWTIVER